MKCGASLSSPEIITATVSQNSPNIWLLITLLLPLFRADFESVPDTTASSAKAVLQAEVVGTVVEEV